MLTCLCKRAVAVTRDSLSAVLDMPAPALLIGGPAAAAAASAAAPYVMYKLSSSVLAAVLARNLWRSLPAWIRDDPAFAKRGSLLRRGSSNNDTADAGDLLAPDEAETEEMATLSDVIGKLDDMVTSAGKTIGTKLKPAQMHAAILAYVQLSNQLRVHCPEARDRLYEKCAFHRHDDNDNDNNCDSLSPQPHITKDELKELRQSLDFATWSYVDYYGAEKIRAKLESVEGDYYLHSHSEGDVNVPGKVGYFIALSPERKEIVIGVKGTSSLEDLVTDAAGVSTPFDMHTGSGGGGANPSTSFGDGHCERMSIEVAMDQETIVVDSVNNQNCTEVDCSDVPTEVGEGVEVELRVEKESIMVMPDGSNVNCHEGVLLSARRLLDDVREVVETLAVKSDYFVRITGHSLGGGAAILLGILLRSAFPILAERDAVCVHAFAPPPVLDIDGATGCEFFVTSVVNNSDIIPRGSVANLAVLMELLRVTNEKLEAMEMGLGGPRRAAALLRKLSQGTGGEMIMGWQEVRDLIEETHRKVDIRNPTHLYVGGRVLLIFDPWTSGQVTRSVLTHGHAAPLRLFEVDALRMLTDHLTTSHEAGLDYLLSEG